MSQLLIWAEVPDKSTQGRNHPPGAFTRFPLAAILHEAVLAIWPVLTLIPVCPCLWKRLML